MSFNFIICAVATLVPTIIEVIWYGAFLGNAWMKEMNFSEESL